MSDGDDEKISQPAGDAANGAAPIPLDDPRVTPLGGNAGVHIKSAQEQIEDDDEVAIDFGGFIISLGTSCMINLGEQADPQTGQSHCDLDAARQVIDILEMLQHKTSGNLTMEEKNLLKSLLRDLRQAYDKAAG